MGSMRRGLGQVLFYFTPNRTFDHGRGVINKVKEIQGEEVRNINTGLLISLLNRRLSDFRNKLGFPRDADEKKYIFLKPKRVIGTIFPTVFRCPECGRVYRHSQYEIEKNGIPSCRVCGKKLTQIHHVMVCSCGRIEEVRIPKCRLHGTGDIKLDDTSERYRDFKWVCLKCGRVIEKGLSKRCSCGKDMKPHVHTDSSVYQVHHITAVDMPEINSEFVDDMDNFTLVAGALTKVFRHPDEKRIADFEGGLIEKLKSNLSEKEIEEFREVLNILKNQKEISKNFTHLKKLLRDDEESKSEHVAEIREIMGKDLIEKLYPRRHRIFEYVKIMEDTNIEPIKLEEVMRIEGLSEEKIIKSKKLLHDFGISEIHYTTAFPIVNAVFGYTRLYDEQDSESVVLRAFPAYRGRTPVYVNRIKSEAIFVRLDPTRVLEWLVSNKYPVDEPSETQSKNHSAILRHLDPVEPYRLDEVNEITKAVFGLQHTISHLMIREASVLSGMERTSIAEFHFPEALSFAIYINSSESFMMGGFLTLIVQNLKEWLYGSFESGRRCIYDPVCLENGGGCHACIHLSEMSCQFFNSPDFLDRAFVYGGKGMKGYWERQP